MLGENKGKYLSLLLLIEKLFAKLRRASAQDSFPFSCDCEKNITMDVVRAKVAVLKVCFVN